MHMFKVLTGSPLGKAKTIVCQSLVPRNSCAGPVLSYVLDVSNAQPLLSHISVSRDTSSGKSMLSLLPPKPVPVTEQGRVKCPGSLLCTQCRPDLENLKVNIYLRVCPSNRQLTTAAGNSTTEPSHFPHGPLHSKAFL